MALYRLLMALLAPVFGAWAVGLWAFGRESLRDLSQRLGWTPAPAHSAPTLWLHAASNGELASAEAVIRALLKGDPTLRLLITTNSVTGRALARRWDLPHVEAILAPIDWHWAATRLLRRWQVIGLVVLEAEVWPNRILATARRGLPVCVIGARLSRRTARSWRRALWIARPVLASLTWVLPQDRGTHRRIRRLGLDPARLGPVTDLKALYSAADAPGPDPELAACFPAARTWLAASTHPGEEEIVLDAHLRARQSWPELELILAPRHPKRADEIWSLIAQKGLACTQRSQGDAPRPGAVYLADTLGEMPRFYANAGICLVAGSLVDRGGHTPYEPASFGCALLHGPHLDNFRAAYRRLDATGGAAGVQDATSLAAALERLRDPGIRARMAQAGQEALDTGTSPEKIAFTLSKHLGRPPTGLD